MPLTAPNLDTRRFKDLVEEARARIPRYTPEWTNFNDSDPGMTLVKLHAWLTETLLFQLNQLPELTYIKFLELLNVQPRPAVAAQAELTFTLKKLSNPGDPLVVLIPRNTQVAVNDPDLEAPLIFETDRTLRALNGALAAVIVPKTGGQRELVTAYDAKKATTTFLHPFYPFGAAPAVNAIFYLGILIRPHRQKDVNYAADRFPAGELDLTAFVPQVFETGAGGQTLTGPEGMHCLFPWQAGEAAELIQWEAYTGSDHRTQFTSMDASAWQPLVLNHDDTAGLARSGHLYLEVPARLPAVRFDQLSRAFWASLSLTKPPTTAEELADDIDGGIISPDALAGLGGEVWDALGVTGATRAELETLLGDAVTNRSAIADLLRPLSLNFNAVATSVWLDASALYDPTPVEHGLTWFRGRLAGPELPEEPPQVSQLLLNTVSATAAVTRVEEILGTSNGHPNQSFVLDHAPVLTDTSQQPPRPELEIELVDRAGQSEPWRPVSDFFGSGADDAVYMLDAATGVLTFGDGRHGRIPLAGSTVIARRYRYGGGSVGNVGPDTITALKSNVSEVDSVTNVRPAQGGGDVESLEDVRLRAPHDLRMRDRAVTAEDFADLALQTPGVPIQRAYALPLTAADTSTTPPTFYDQPGAVTVIILPMNREETPQPTEEQLRLVCQHLNQRRLITTELYVAGPSYLRLDKLKAEVVVSRQADLKTVQEAVTGRLLAYFHPLHGGEDGRGWPFGQDIFYGNVYRQILSVAEVYRVVCLEIEPADPALRCDDYVELPGGALVHLPRTALDVKVIYDPHG
ncbi:MAG: putative baseplate assembly protein [Chloroflexi bacterium]|nr:putative baseplate assembly protein [Chloroflexota bacterium]